MSFFKAKQRGFGSVFKNADVSASYQLGFAFRCDSTTAQKLQTTAQKLSKARAFRDPEQSRRLLRNRTSRLNEIITDFAGRRERFQVSSVTNISLSVLSVSFYR